MSAAEPRPPGGLNPEHRLRPRAYLLLALAALAIFLPGLARLPPLDRDESRYAQATTQMLESRDFVDVRYQDHARYLQPAGVYWLQSASVSLLSSPKARAIWAFRVPSVLAATGAVLLTAWIGTMFYGPAAGVGAALLMAASVLLGFEARNAKIDACLCAATLAAQAALARIYLGRDSAITRPRATAALFWAAMGVGLMLKGPIICIVSGTTVLALGLVERRWRWLKGLHAGWGVLLTLLIVLPWFVAIGVVSHGAFFTKAVGHNLLGKVGRGEQAHGQPPGYYLALFSLTFWPGSLAAMLALPFVWRERATPAVRFLLAWTIPTWLMFEAVATKLPHYVLPVYPAIACLAAGAALSPGGWAVRARDAGRWVRRIASGAYGALWLGIGAALAVAGPVLVWNLDRRVDGVAVAAAVLALSLMVGCAVLVARRQLTAALAAGVLASGVIAADTYAETLPTLDPIWIGPRLAAEFARVKPCPDAVLASSAFSEPSLVFLTSKDTRLIPAPEAADFLAQAPACRLAVVSAAQRPAFIAQAAADRIGVRAVGEVDGRSYSTGKRLALTFYAAISPGSVR